jgi:hypothetical protein
MGISKTLIIIGVSFIFLGGIVGAAQRIPWVYSWFGHLPGDIRIEGERTFVYAPLTSMVVVSIIVSVVAWIGQRFMAR